MISRYQTMNTSKVSGMKLLLIFILLGLSACGGGSNKTNTPAVVNQTPVAITSADFNSQENSPVNLDGSTSNDPDGSISSYQWSQSSGSINVSLNNADTSIADFTAPAVTQNTVLIFELLVTDNSGASDTATITVTITPLVQGNLSPIAVVAADFNATENTGVNLNGSTSSDADGSIASYQWSQISGTPTVALTNANTTIASFTAPAVNSDTPLTFQLTVTDDQGAVDTASITVMVLNVSTSTLINVSLLPSRTSCTAPCGVMFDATQTTASGISEPFHQLHYRWDYGDASATFVQRNAFDANQSKSPIGAHVFETHGSYTVSLEVSASDGSVASQQTVISVSDPDTDYAANTYCVSTLDNFTACPTSNSANHFNSYQSAATFMNGIRFMNPMPAIRVLFHSGESFDVTTTTTLRDISSPLLISTYDTGAAPVLQVDDASMADDSIILYVRDSDNISISGLKFQGNYDPVNGTGNHVQGIFLYEAVTNTTIFRNSFSALDVAVYPSGLSSSTSGKSSQHTMIVDNNISDWQDYGIFGVFGHLSTLMANTIKQNSAAISGAEGKCGSCTPNYPDHGPLRSGESYHLLIQYNDMFNNAGWSSAGLAHQPNIRLGTGGASVKSVVADNLLEGGFSMLSMTPANPGLASAARQAEVIIERNRFTASSNTWQMIDMGLGGAVIRNNLFLKPDNGAPTIGTGTFEAAISYKVADDRTTAENLTYINRIYNNTLISLSLFNAPNLTLIEIENNFSLFEIYNNLLYLPYVDSANASNGAGGLIRWSYAGSISGLDSNNNLLYAPLNSNFVWNNGANDLLSWQTSGNDAQSIVLDPMLTDPVLFDASLLNNSPAIDAGKALAGLMLDFKQADRDTSPDIGALEF